MATATATKTPIQTGSNPPHAQKTIEEFRALFADAPELGKKALENVLTELKSQVSEPRAKVESAGRVGARLGKRSELTMIVPLTPSGAKRLRAAVRMLGGAVWGGAARVRSEERRG